MKTYNLFLDDFRHPYDCVNYMIEPRPYAKLEWVIVRNYQEFIDEIQSRFNAGEFPEVVSFDHDLAEEHYDGSMYSGVETYNKTAQRFTEPTGKECADWLVQFCIDNSVNMPNCLFHTMNPAGKERLKLAIADYEKYKSQI